MPAPRDWPVRRGRAAHVSHSPVIAMGQASGLTAEAGVAVTSDQPRAATQREVRAFLAEAASGCGRLLNSVMVVIGDRFGLYKTGQYSSDTDDDLPRRTLQHPVRTG
jgi:hypothetical protein